MDAHQLEVRAGERFEFGKNWQNFLERLDDERIDAATRSLAATLGLTTLEGKSFIDIGSGSGLFSLAARRLGATVTSFDFDPQSVACTEELKRRYFQGDGRWRVLCGSVLDREFLAGLGTFDIVYSWGVLHHTGAMWDALGNVAPLVDGEGQLFIAIYNDQGGASRRWLSIKKLYNRSPRVAGPLLVLSVGAYFVVRDTLIRLLHRQKLFDKASLERTGTRGMSFGSDLVDWVGGYPFEVAKPEEIFRFYRDHGFDLSEMTTCGGGLGCNEYVFRRRPRAGA